MLIHPAPLLVSVIEMSEYGPECANCNEEWFSGPMERGEDRIIHAFREMKGAADVLKSISSLKIMLEVKSQELEEEDRG